MLKLITGWRKSSATNIMPSQFQPVIDLYGRDNDQVWTGRNYSYDDSVVTPKRRSSEVDYRKSPKNLRNQSNDDPASFFDQPYEPYYTEDRRRSPYEPNSNRRASDERTPRRKYTPPEGIYRQNPNRYASQHNLYYTRSTSTPQRTFSNRSIHELRHMGDIRFP